MPKGYVIYTGTIRDQARFDAYVENTVPTITQSGGRPIVVQDDPDVLDGEAPGSRIVVLEFDSVEAARAWYESPEYQAVVGERLASAEGGAVIVSGFEMPSG